MGRWSRKLASQFLNFAGLKDDDSVLDVGSGTGAVVAAFLDLTRSGQLIGIEPSAEYVKYARIHTEDPRVTFEQGDGQRTRFSTDTFDRTVSLLVINFIPDREKALKEMIRITRPGGVVASAVWDYGGGMEMLRIFWDEAVRLDPSIDPRDERNMPLCKPGELEALWKKAGLVDVKEEPLVVSPHFSSFEDFWSPFLKGQGPAGAYVASLTDGRKSRLEGALRSRIEGRNGEPIHLAARAWAVKGTVPED